MFALDVEEPDFLEIEQVAVKLEPDIHITFVHIVSKVIEVEKSNTARMGAGDPFELFVVWAGVIILVDEIDKRATNPDDCRSIQSLVWPFVSLCSLCNRVMKSVICVDNTPPH